MMGTKTLEQGRNSLTTWLGNATALPVQWIKPLFSVAIGFIDNFYDHDEELEYQAYHKGYPLYGWHLIRLDFGQYETKSLFYNSVFYVRLMLPFWIGFQFRWAGKDPSKREYFQCGIGWKLNGRFAVLCRVQSDDSAAAGVQGPNHDQASGFEYGTK